MPVYWVCLGSYLGNDFIYFSQSRIGGNGGFRSLIKSLIPSSPDQKKVQLHTHKPNYSPSSLTVEDQEMLWDVCKRKPTVGVSKSQKLDSAKTGGLSKSHRFSKSINYPPTSESKLGNYFCRRSSYIPVIDFDIDRIKALDVIDRVDTIRSL